MLELNAFLNKILNENFDTNSKYFKKLIMIYNDEQLGIIEKHHIIPKSYFKLKKEKIINENNIINLSARNHFKAHYYMWKSCKEQNLKNKLATAFLLLNSLKNYKEENLDIDSIEYENIKKQSISYLQKKIICLNTCKIYNSLSEASNYNENIRKQITNVITNKQTTAYGKYWEEYDPNINYTKEYCENKIKEIEKAKKDRIYFGKHKNDSKYICLNTCKIYNNIGEINVDYPNSGVSTNLKRNRKKIAGKYWEEYDPNINYTKEYCENKIKEIEKTYNRKKILCCENNVEYSSIRIAAKELNIDPSCISKFLNGKLKSVKGYHFIIIN